MVENVVIIGSGPAGLSAALYTAREGFNPLLIKGSGAGGQLLLTTDIENYPGYDKIAGPELIRLMEQQATSFGTRFLEGDVTKVELSAKPIRLHVNDTVIETLTLIISTGASSKWIGLPSEKNFTGRGVSSCATCLLPSSLVVTNPSVKQIKNITKGVKVLTHKGRFKKVIEVSRQRYKGKVIKFKTRFFRSEPTTLTPNHPVLVRELNRGTGPNYHNFNWSEPFWIPAGKIGNNHIVMYPIPKEVRKIKYLEISKILNLPTDKNQSVKLGHETYSSHRITNKIPLTKPFARLIGYYLSEGFAHSRGVSFAFSKDEIDYVNDCKSIIENTFHIKPTSKLEKSVIRVTVSSLILSMLFEKLFGKYSHTKKLPQKFVLLNSDLQKEIVNGIWRGDGSVRKTDFIITSSSRELIEQLKIILLRLGVLPGVEKRKFSTLRHSNIDGREVEFKKDVYQIVIGGPWAKIMGEIVKEIPEMAKTRRHNNYHAWIMDGYAHLPIKKVWHPSHDGFVYNLAVEGDNTYVTTNSIVHNCDGAFFKNKDVIVVGGGDTAMEDSLFLTRFANNVTIVHRKDSFRASKIMQERVFANPKIKVIWDTVVEEVTGDRKVTGARVKNVKTNQITEMKVDGVFIAIGHQPNTSLFKEQLELDKDGYIITKDDVLTNIEGVYAAGDVADRFYKQAVTAAASGVKAALRVREYLSMMKFEEEQRAKRQ
ncbi:MAG: FAD-dependent oxidoreductase [Candidatus Micrarchaeota archaeon]|nr:FAD-dependent oxidoreductase [Candidatus Micrarchaeota archaeon]